MNVQKEGSPSPSSPVSSNPPRGEIAKRRRDWGLDSRSCCCERAAMSEAIAPQSSTNGAKGDSMIRRVEADDWDRLRDVRLRALAADPDAFLETAENARAFRRNVGVNARGQASTTLRSRISRTTRSP